MKIVPGRVKMLRAASGGASGHLPRCSLVQWLPFLIPSLSIFSLVKSVKFGILSNYLSVRNRSIKVLNYRVTVGWLPNLIGMFR